MSATTDTSSLLQRIKKVVAKLGLQAALALRRICSNPENPDDSGTDAWITSIHIPVVFVLASIGAVSCFLTLTASGRWVVVLASLLTLLLSPYLVLQKQVLAVLEDLRKRQRELKQRINDFRDTNQLLNQSIETLEPQMQTMSLVEGDLNQIAAEARVDKDHLIRVVEETGRLHKMIHQQLRTQIIREIMATVTASSDSNQNFMLNENDVKKLRSRLVGLSQVIQIDEVKFRQLQQDDKAGRTLMDVTKLLRNLLDPTIPKEHQIFQVSLPK